MKLPELMGAIERSEDLVRRYCGQRDARRNVEALLPDDHEKHVRLNGAFGKGKGKQGKGKHGKGKGKGKQGQQGQQGRDRSKDKDKNKDSIECWNCGKRGHYSKDCWSKKNNKGGSKGKHKSKNATDAHNLDSTKPGNVEPEVEIGEFDMGYLDVDTVEVQGSEWIKIGVDTGARKTA